MCGGRGTRLGSDDTEKPLLSICGRPMLDRVVDALAVCETVYAVVSPHTPETAARARNVLDCSTIETPGAGYVADLDCALSRVEPPVLSVAADLPLLDGETVAAVLDRAVEGSLTVCVPAERKRTLGVSVDTDFEHEGRTLAPSGVNVVADATDELMIRDSYRLAVNVNRPQDAQVAEELCE